MPDYDVSQFRDHYMNHSPANPVIGCPACHDWLADRASAEQNPAQRGIELMVTEIVKKNGDRPGQYVNVVEWTRDPDGGTVISWRWYWAPGDAPEAGQPHGMSGGGPDEV